MRIPATIEDAIWKAERIFPALARWSVKVPEQGGQNFTLIYGDKVVRMPRNETCLAELKKEAEILSHLQSHDLGVRIPQLLDFDEAHQTIIISRMEGRALNAFNLNAMSNSEYENIGMQLGTFLYQLHTHRDGIMNQQEYADKERAYHAKILLQAHHPSISAAAGISFDRLREIDRNYLRDFAHIKDEIVQLHGDVSYGNILFDSASGKIAVVDFMSAREGYRHEDFLSLNNFPQTIQDECLEIYGLLAGKAPDRELISLARDARNVCRLIERGMPLDHNAHIQRNFV